MEPPQELPEKFARMGLTYDDVLLLPGYSEIAPSDIDTSTSWPSPDRSTPAPIGVAREET